MRSKSILVVLFLASIAVLGFVFWHNGTEQVRAKEAGPATAWVLVAAAPLGTGTLLRSEDVRWQPWNTATAPGYILRPSAEELKAVSDAEDKALASVRGAVLRQRLEAGGPITYDLIVKPGDRGFLAAVLVPGHRAIAVAVTAVSGAAGLIFPGDHVDVILTQSFKDTQEPIARRSVGETIVDNLRVLAVDQHLQQVTPDPGAGGQVARTVTLEVLPEQAEMISVAAELGKLSLTLRGVPSAKDPQVADTRMNEATRSTWADDVSPALRPRGTKPHTTASPVVRVWHGAKVEDVKQN